MKVVVLGATGNVGTSVVRALTADAGVQEVVALARRPPELEWPKVTWGEADVTESDLVPLFRGAAAVVHLVGTMEPADDADALTRINVGGTERVLAALREAGVPALVYASSAAAYAERPPDDRPVDESWPMTGIPSSAYSVAKAEVEALLGRFEQASPVRVVRIRFSAAIKREAGAQARDQYFPRVFPTWLLAPGRIPFFPHVEGLRFQAVHADDLGELFRLAVTSDASGAFNAAADPVLDGRTIAKALRAPSVPAPPGTPELLRTGMWLGAAVGLQPLAPSWLDFVRAMPLMDSTRARTELGWQPKVRADDALLELLEGVREGSSEETAVLE